MPNLVIPNITGYDTNKTKGRKRPKTHSEWTKIQPELLALRQQAAHVHSKSEAGHAAWRDNGQGCILVDAATRHIEGSPCKTQSTAWLHKELQSCSPAAACQPKRVHWLQPSLGLPWKEKTVMFLTQKHYRRNLDDRN